MTHISWRDVRPRARRSSTIWLLALLIVLGLIPLRVFLRRFIESDYLALAVSVPDISYYYLLPAWRVHTHGFFTFDGIHRTYGFQPLYMVVLSGLSAILPSIEALLRVALGLNATLHVATGVLIGLVVDTALFECSDMVRFVASLVASAVYLFGWNLFWVNLTLKENALATFLYVLAIFSLVRALSAQREQARERSIGSDVWLGTLIGLLILARLLPSSLLAAGVMIGVVWACLSRRSAMIISAAMLAPLLIWGMYAKLAFGHVLPSPILMATGGAGILGAVRHWWSVGFGEMYAWVGSYARWAFSLFSDKDVSPGRFLTRAGFLGLGMSGLVVCTPFAAWWSRWRATIVLLVVASVAGVLAIPALEYATTQRLLTWSTWYLFDVSAILTIACAAVLGFLAQQGIARLPPQWAKPRPRVAALLIAVVWLGAAATEFRSYRTVPVLRWDKSGCTDRDGPCASVPDSSLEKTTANVTLWFRSAVHLANGERAAAFNAGFVGLLLLPTPVVDLDGLANDDIHGELLGRVGAWPSRALAGYISREQIRYVIDHVPAWTEWETVVGLKTELLKEMEGTDPSTGPRWYYVAHFLPSPSSQGDTTLAQTSNRTFGHGPIRTDSGISPR
jgi:hypothetical protein